MGLEGLRVCQCGVYTKAGGPVSRWYTLGLSSRTGGIPDQAKNLCEACYLHIYVSAEVGWGLCRLCLYTLAPVQLNGVSSYYEETTFNCTGLDIHTLSPTTTIYIYLGAGVVWVVGKGCRRGLFGRK